MPLLLLLSLSGQTLYCAGHITLDGEVLSCLERLRIPMTPIVRVHITLKCQRRQVGEAIARDWIKRHIFLMSSDLMYYYICGLGGD
jgi:hypothetical protein